MPTYREYQEQIAKLQSLAEQARQDEIAEARRQIRELMQQHDLQLGDLANTAKKAKTGPTKGAAKAKYRHPDTGATWSGRGRAPRWLNGRVKEDFLIK